MTSLKKGLIGSTLLIFQKFLAKSIGLISTLILARVLLPEDFGLVAMATIFTGLVSVLGNTGAKQYIVRASKVTDEMLNTSWSINIVLKTIIALIIVIMAQFVSGYYNEPRLNAILYFSAFSTIINSFSNPGVHLLSRAMDYKPIIIMNLIGKTLAVIVAIYIAVTYESHWALILGQFTSSFTKMIGTYFIHPFRPRISFTNYKTQYSFSVWLVGQSIFGYIRTQLDSFLVASTFSANELGQYNTMKYISFMPNTLILGPATGPLLRQLSNIKENNKHFKNRFNVSTLVSLVIALPMAFLMYINSQELVSIILGDNWVKFAHLFATFSFLIPAYALYHQAHRTLIVFNNTKFIFIYEIFSVLFIYLIIYVIGFKNIELFTLTKVILENLISVFFIIYVTTKFMGIANTIRLSLLCCPLLLANVIAFKVALLMNDVQSMILTLLLKSTIYSLIYLFILIIYIYLFKNKIGEVITIYTYLNKILNKIVNK